MLWDTDTGKPLQKLEGHQLGVLSVAFSPDGKTILSGGWRELMLWDAATGARLPKFEGNNDGDVWSVAFSHDGTRVAAGGEDGFIRLWNPATGKLLQSFADHSGRVKSIAFSPDDSRIVSGSHDGTVKLRSLQTGKPLVSLFAHDDEWRAITRDGFFAGSQTNAAAQLANVVREFDEYSTDGLFQALYRPDRVRQTLSDDFDEGLKITMAAESLNLETVLNSGAAPRVAILSPKNNSVVREKIAIDAALHNQNGGIGRVEWRINGVTRAVERLQHAADHMKLQRTFDVGAGPNVIEVVAYNSRNLVASLPATIVVTSKPEVPRPLPTLHLLAVGINDYLAGSLKLNFADSDAKAVGAAFQLPQSSAGLYKSVVVHPLVLDGAATKQGLRAAFEELGKSVRSEDVFILYMSGHGATLDGKYYFIPQDAKDGDLQAQLESSIGQDQLQEWMTHIPALRSVLIYDTCESGSTTADISRLRDEQQLMAVEKLSKSSGRTVLTASTDSAPAREGYKKHAIFTYVLLDALALADTNNNGRIEVGELGEYLKAKLPVISETTKFGRQVPQVRITGSDFSLVNRASVVDIERIRQ
jgi:WD40 repeat protein